MGTERGAGDNPASPLFRQNIEMLNTEIKRCTVQRINRRGRSDADRSSFDRGRGSGPRAPPAHTPGRPSRLVELRLVGAVVHPDRCAPGLAVVGRALDEHLRRVVHEWAGLAPRNRPVVGPDGALYIAYVRSLVTVTPFAPQTAPIQLVVARSTDGGQTFQSYQVDDDIHRVTSP